MTRNQLDNIFASYAQPGSPIEFPAKILRLLRALILKAIPRSGVPLASAPAPPATKVELVNFTMSLTPENSYKLEWSVPIARFVSGFIKRFGREKLVIVNPPATVYDTVLNGPSDTKEGVTMTSAGSEQMKFNKKATGSSLPANMHFFLENVELASMDFPARYLGDKFSFQAGSRLVEGIFTNGNTSDV